MGIKSPHVATDEIIAKKIKFLSFMASPILGIYLKEGHARLWAYEPDFDLQQKNVPFQSPGWDSNPHFTRFKRDSSAVGIPGVKRKPNLLLLRWQTIPSQI